MSEANAVAIATTAHPIPEELRDAWAKVEANNHQPHITRGLRLIASGWSIHAASAESGAERMHLSRLAARYGLYTSSLLLGGQRRIAAMALDRLEQDYLDGGANVSHAQAAVDAGIAMDKIAKYENWGKSEPPPPANHQNAITELINALKAGEHLTLTVSKRIDDPVVAAIDVTPQG